MECVACTGLYTVNLVLAGSCRAFRYRSMLFTLLALIVALGILITFHELGHYWVARLCGVRVLRFSVGCGKVLARRTDRHGTEWAGSAIPLGGYVQTQANRSEEQTFDLQLLIAHL